MVLSLLAPFSAHRQLVASSWLLAATSDNSDTNAIYYLTSDIATKIRILLAANGPW